MLITLNYSTATVIADLALLRKLSAYLTFREPNYMSGRVFIRRLMDKRGTIPIGLIDRVIDYCNTRNIPFTLKDKRGVPKPVLGLHKLKTTYNPYPDQMGAADAAISNKSGIISMPTGTGKSLVIALLTSRLQVRTLIVVPTLEIKKQMEGSLINSFGSLKGLQVENIDSSALKKATDFDCLIIDEAHHVAAKTYQKLNRTAWSKIYYRFFLTATPFRNKTNEYILFEAIAGKLIYQLSYKKAISKNYIVPVEAYYFDLPHIKNDISTYPRVYSELVVNNKARNELISNLLLNLKEAKVSTLCMVKEIKHGNNIAELSGIQFCNGQDEESRLLISAFNNINSGVLIGTTGIIGEGVDTKPCEYVIIAGLGKAKSQFMQQIGRGVRRYHDKKSCKVVLFRDTSNKYLLRHFREQCKILREEYGIEPTKLEL